jgi:hypothetical protein
MALSKGNQFKDMLENLLKEELKYGLLLLDLEMMKDIKGIPPERVHFTDMDDKWPFLKFFGDFLWHLDDDWIENKDILKNTQTKAISSIGANWKSKCERLIKKKMLE